MLVTLKTWNGDIYSLLAKEEGWQIWNSGLTFLTDCHLLEMTCPKSFDALCHSSLVIQCPPSVLGHSMSTICPACAPVGRLGWWQTEMLCDWQHYSFLANQWASSFDYSSSRTHGLCPSLTTTMPVCLCVKDINFIYAHYTSIHELKNVKDEAFEKLYYMPVWLLELILQGNWDLFTNRIMTFFIISNGF